MLWKSFPRQAPTRALVLLEVGYPGPGTAIQGGRGARLTGARAAALVLSVQGSEVGQLPLEVVMGRLGTLIGQDPQ